MAVRFNNLFENYERTTTFGSQGQFTIAGWVKISVDRNDFSTFFDVSGTPGERFIVQTDSDGTTVYIFAPGSTVGASSLTVGTWYYLAATSNGTSASLYIRAHNATSFTVNSGSTSSSAYVLDHVILGDSGLGNEWLNGCLAAVKLWVGAALNEAELARESQTYLPSRTANLAAWYPFAGPGTTVDLSGNGQTLSGGSGTSLEDGPPIAWRQGRRRLFLPGTVSAEITPSTVAATTTIPSPILHTGSTLHPATVAATVAVPTPTISFGATISLATVAATASVPAPSVTAGSVEEIALDAVATTAAVPDPAISTSVSLTPATVAAVVAAPSPTVSGEFNAEIPLSTVATQAAIPIPGISVPVLPGDLLTGDYQIEYAGEILFGAPPYIILEDTVEGWDDLVELDSGNVLRAQTHGAFAGRKFGQQRYVSATILVADDTDTFMDRIKAIRRAARVLPDATEPNLVVRTRGETLLARGQIIGRVVPPRFFYSGFAVVPLRWECSDPRRYSLQRYSRIVGTTSAEVLENVGDTESQPVIRITGPAELPQITNETAGLTIAFDIQLEVGERLDIDCFSGTVTIGSVDHTRSIAGLPVQAWALHPGDNTITYAVDSAGQNGIEILYHDAYM
ncbi:LamG-like jellyroll fold domain-containing protein [Acrocarpospora sp. B8E8]|uniref:LamG-like jellyroll fold domain-containing protein n=1 Tax=Acrocarpospora sp. B8E8 TaxID=3153572 RepID=UPI00325D1909